MDDDTANGSRRRGPRAGDTAWREKILDTARGKFGELGYQATTMRKLGQAAGVDPKLIHYYFGSKEELFSAAIADAFRSHGFVNLVAQATVTTNESPGRRYLHAILTALENSELSEVFLGLIRNLGTHEESRRIFIRFVSEQLAETLVPRLSIVLPEARVALAGSQLLGLIMARYIVKMPPLATLTIDETVDAVGPTLDRYLFEDFW